MTRSCSSSTSRPTGSTRPGIVAMREHAAVPRRRPARPSLISSHILPEVQQLADVVGIIDKGHLVHQGSLDELLKASGGVRVRLLPDEVERARAALGRAGGPEAVSDSNGPGGEPEEGHGWLAIRIAPERAAEVNRALAEAGIYASGIETRSDLESIFLSLTTGDGT